MIQEPGSRRSFHGDLPAVLAESGSDGPFGEWRIHFHVPLYLKSFGLLDTTQEQVNECLAALKNHEQVRHFEAETYAWSVLPSELRVDDLAVGIARELTWLRRQFPVPSTA